MRVNVINKVIGDVFEATWVSSGMQAAPISSAILGKAGVVVDSVSAVFSGNGHYYARHQLPNTPARWTNEWRAWINSYQYVSRQFVNVQMEAID